MENSKTLIVRMLCEIAAEEGYKIEGFAFDWVFRFAAAGGKSTTVYGYKFPVNDAAAASLCDDKSAMSELLGSSGIPNVPHHFFMSPRDRHYIGEQGDERGMRQLLAKYGELVIKPNFGTGGYEVTRVTDEAQLKATADMIFQTESALAISPFLTVNHEYRVVMLGGESRLLFEKQRPTVTGNGKDTIAALLREQGKKLENPAENPSRIPAQGERVTIGWKHNLGAGASPMVVADETLSGTLSALAKRTVALLGLQFASVDIVDTGREYLVLEVNSGVMLEHFAASSPENYQMAKDIYRDALQLAL